MLTKQEGIDLVHSVSCLLDLLERLDIKSAGANYMHDQTVLKAGNSFVYIKPFVERMSKGIS